MLVEEEILSAASLMDEEVKAPITSHEFEDYLMATEVAED